jgi:hypothetical protein
MKGSTFWDITLWSSLKAEWLCSACCLLHAGLLLGLFFDPEDGRDVFLRNVG